MRDVRIVDMDAGNIFDYGFCGTKNPQHEGCRRKAEWFKNRQKEGMKYKVLYSEEKGTVGLIEYIPGEYAWRGIEADGYMVIHCLCIFHKPYREKGVASQMIDECFKDAKKEKKHGVAVVTRKGAWMVGKEIFLKGGFELVDKTEPDFELLAIKFKKDAPSPKFKGNWDKILAKYNKGLTILWTDQCPYIAKSIREIRETIKERYVINANIVELKDHEQVQNAPSPYASFSLIYDGELLAFHPISNKRFMNIMDKILRR
ncbi:MAG: YoaP domain-containing protein [Candidatus Aminicenantes bacterium]|nr:MAG: YoaP domain-containing protein [Candidatus Aminicenantes bacterium]